MFIELIKGAALLLALSLLQGFILRYWRQNEVLGQIVSGVLFGSICIIGMKLPLEVVPGVIFDARSVVLSMSGLFGGPIVGGIAAVIAGGYRAWIGGGGANVGVAVVISCMSLGLAYRYCRDRGWVNVGVFQLLAFGFLVHAVEVLLFTQLPPEIVQNVMDNVSIPLLLTFTPATVFLGMLLQDIDNRVATENALYESEERFRAFVSNTPNKLHIKDAEGRYILINPQCEKLYGVTNAEARGKTSADIFPKEVADPFGAHDRAVLETGKAVKHEEEFSEDGVKRTYLTIKFPIRNAAKNIISVGASGIDITERKQAEKSLKSSHDELERRVEQRTAEFQHAKEVAEKASLAKTKFLAAASHDLRQPLQALNLFLCSLADREHDAKSQQIIKRISQSAEALGELLHALLDISKLEAGLIVPHKKRFNIADFLDLVSGEFEHIAQDKGLKFRTIACQAEVVSDPVLLNNIIRNLISNSIRYTKQGKILLGCRHRDDLLRIEVWDTGIGIAEKHQGQIFQEFYQVGNLSRDRHQGLGLGLSIVCKTAELLEHGIEVRSVLGKGTVFSVEVPIADGDTKDISHVVPKQLPMFKKQLFIVVIDDDIDVLDSVQHLLEGNGCHVLAITCLDHDGQGKRQDCQTVGDIFQPGAAPPDLIIADYNLQNGMTGIDAVTMLHEHFKAKIPAVLLTGDIKPDSLCKIEESGLPVLHKPIKGERLHEVVHEMLGSNPAG